MISDALGRIADKVKNFAALYVCDLDEVPDFKAMYELYDACTIMFFFRNKHMYVFTSHFVPHRISLYGYRIEDYT